MESNQNAYSSERTVAEYTAHIGLQKGEESIVNKFKAKILGGNILDIGIGAGRTSEHLIPLASKYTGIDFSEPFVNICKERFSSQPNAHIYFGDARDLGFLPSKSFDFVFFSFNGIDYVDYEGRQKIFNEFSRLIKDDGILSFSFHNKGNLDKLYSFQFPRNPFKYIWEWNRMNKVKSINGDKEIYKKREWFIIKDGGENFTLDTFYADGLHEVTKLKEFGFKTFFFHDAVTGHELSLSDLQTADTPWIYLTALKQ